MFFVCCIYYKKSNIPVALSFLIIFSAVRGGFEPPVRLPARQFSKLKEHIISQILMSAA